MEEVLRYVIGSLVEFPEDVILKKTETHSNVGFLVAARPSDIPKIIGKITLSVFRFFCNAT